MTGDRELDLLVAAGLEAGAEVFLIPRSKIPADWFARNGGYPDKLAGKALVVCDSLMECVQRAVKGEGWLLNPRPMEGVQILPSDNGDG